MKASGDVESRAKVSADAFRGAIAIDKRDKARGIDSSLCEA